jgi:hypothetical protein
VFVLWTAALFLAARRYEAVLKRTVGKLLIPLGANSLYVYIMQSVILFAVPYFGLPLNYVINTLVTVAVVGLLWLLVRYRILFWLVPR